MKCLTARAKLPPTHIVDGHPVFWVEISGTRVLRPWWEGEWADQAEWVNEVVETIRVRGSAFNPAHKAELLRDIPSTVISGAIQTAWTSWGRSVNMAMKPAEIQQASISKNTQNGRKGSVCFARSRQCSHKADLPMQKAEKREVVLGSEYFSPEFVKRNAYLRHGPYASSENTEGESDDAGPITTRPVIDASSPPQSIDRAKADQPKKGKVHLALVSHPPDYRTDDVSASQFISLSY